MGSRAGFCYANPDDYTVDVTTLETGTPLYFIMYEEANKRKWSDLADYTLVRLIFKEAIVRSQEVNIYDGVKTERIEYQLQFEDDENHYFTWVLGNHDRRGYDSKVRIYRTPEEAQAWINQSMYEQVKEAEEALKDHKAQVAWLKKRQALPMKVYAPNGVDQYKDPKYAALKEG
jgi:hypothetical protein